MATYPLIVAQYPIIGHIRRSEHWNLIVMKSLKEVYVYELTGNHDSYAYISRAEGSFGSSQTMRGGCQVGTIAEEKLIWLEKRLQDVRVVRHDPDFDCQTWVMEAIRMLKDDGVDILDVTERSIRAELALELERWEVADDTIEERLFKA